ncbi:MAG TPA: sigma-54 dependent transcriptional regulator [Methylomirabilota bacterium]|jgi:DNA-binding NtrC family response regulator|nr:sigma-54 dependent transcriptional regulator [Methylomirabilota bacterium]
MDSILVIDDERSVRQLLSKVFAQEQVEIYTASTAAEGLQKADDADPDIILLDLRLPDASGLEVLKTLKARHPDTPVIMITGFGQVESAVEAMKHGATDYLEKPFEPLDKLRLAVGRLLDEVKAHREIQRLHQLQARMYGVDQIIGDSESTRHLRQVIRQVAQSEAQTILILGESGTGKELVAKGLHYEGARREFPFMEVNCAAITETLFESELFGHEKGSFTDAKGTKKGLMELADRGTLFLDEVSEMAPGSQAKLLRCLQERVFRRVGGTRDIKVDVRVIAATNRPLEALTREGKFREDLFYRLNVIPIAIPPLRARREDILPLARHFLVELNATFHKAIKSFTPDTERLLLAYPWPGNVRELRNLIERLVILTTSDSIEPQHLPPPFGAPADAPGVPRVSGELTTLADVERAYILQAVEKAKGNKSLAAKILGISRQTLRKKLEGA